MITTGTAPPVVPGMRCLYFSDADVTLYRQNAQPSCSVRRQRTETNAGSLTRGDFDIFLGWTALMHAASNGALEGLEAACLTRANVHAAGLYRETALMEAVVSLRKDIAQVLLNSGADREHRDDRGIMADGRLDRLWTNDDGQNVAEYAVMLAVTLMIVIGTVRLIGGQSNNVFSEVASSIQ